MINPKPASRLARFQRQRRWALGALTVLPWAMLGCTGTGNRIDPPIGFQRAPAPRSGERWRYQRINRFNHQPLGEILAEVIQTEPEVIVRLSDTQGAVWGEEIYSQPWQVTQEPIYNETLRFSDPVRLLPEQLAVGKSHVIQTTYRLGDDQHFRAWESRLEVPGWERISVPAGQFDCLRVQRTIYFEPNQMSRFDARRIDTLWYAPAVNRWVQRVLHN